MKSFDNPDIMFPHYMKMEWTVSIEEPNGDITSDSITLEKRCYIGYRTETPGYVYLTVIAPLIGTPKMSNGDPLPSGATLRVAIKMNESDSYVYCQGPVSAFQCKLWKNVGTVLRCCVTSNYPF
jgi:hypothetical protein